MMHLVLPLGDRHSGEASVDDVEKGQLGLEDLIAVLGASAASGKRSQGVHQRKAFVAVQAPVANC